MPLINEADPARAVAELLRVRSGGSTDHRPRAVAVRRRPDLRPLDDVIHARRAVRGYADHPLRRSDVEWILRNAYATFRSWWPGMAGPDTALTAIVAVYDVVDVERGLYAAREDGGFIRLPGTSWLREFRDAYALAPVVVGICGDLRWALSPAGPDYGGLLVGAGALGHAIWLSAVSIGLAGCVFGSPAYELNAAAQDVTPGLRHLFTVAIGTE